jgi:hypothetical protein
MSESMARSPKPVTHRGIRRLSRVLVVWGILLLLLSIGLLLIASLFEGVATDRGGPSGIVALVMAGFLRTLGVVGEVLGGLTIVSGVYIRRLRPWTWWLAVVVTALRSLAIVALTVVFGYLTRSWLSGCVLLVLIPEIAVTVYLRKIRADFCD